MASSVPCNVPKLLAKRLGAIIIRVNHCCRLPLNKRLDHDMDILDPIVTVTTAHESDCVVFNVPQAEGHLPDGA